MHLLKQNLKEYHFFRLIIWRSLVQAQAGPQYISKHLPQMVGAFFVYITKVYLTSYEIPDFVKIIRIFRERESLKIHRQYLWLQIRHSREV